MPRGVLLMVGTMKGLFLFTSDSSRRTWTMTGPHLAGWEVSAVHLHRGRSGSPPRLFAGTKHYSYGATFRVSDDMGASWREMVGRPEYSKESGFKVNRVWQIVSHPTESDTLLCGIDEAGLFKSTDAGQTWQEIRSLTSAPDRRAWFPGNGGLCLHTIVIDRTNPDRIWLGISAVGAFRTTDGGNSWHECRAGLEQMDSGEAGRPKICCIHKIVQDPKDPDTLYAQHHPGVYRTTNGGDSWEKVETGLPGNFGFPMVISRKGELFVAPLQADEMRYMKDGRFRVYRSRNGGKNWQATGKGLPEGRFVGVLRDAMATDGMAPAGVYVGTTMGEVFWSNNAGDSWKQLPYTFPRIEMVKAFEIDLPVSRGSGKSRRRKLPTRKASKPKRASVARSRRR